MNWHSIFIAVLILNIAAVGTMVLMFRKRRDVDRQTLLFGFTFVFAALVTLDYAAYLVRSHDRSPPNKVQVSVPV